MCSNSPFRLGLLTIALASLVPPAAATAAPAAAAPVIVEGRVVAIEASPFQDRPGRLYTVEVDRVVHGDLLASTVVVHSPGGVTAGASTRGPAAPRLRTGGRYQLVIRPREDGDFELLSGRRLLRAEAPRGETLPGGIAVEPPAPPVDRAVGVAPLAPGPTFEESVVELLNQERWTYNSMQLPPLKMESLLNSSSEDHSFNMADRDFFAHCDLDQGTSPFDRMWAAGYFFTWAGENIAAGYATPEAVMAGWMASPGHRANILSTDFREVGVGYVLQSGDQGDVRYDLAPAANPDCVADSFNHGPFFHYWTQNFGSRSTVYPVVIDREAHQTTTTAVDLYVYGAGWAQEMRFSNDQVSWSAWEPYSPDKAWSLTAGGGLKTVFAELRNGATVRAASDAIVLAATCTAPDTLDLAMESISSTEEYVACTTITAHDFEILSPGDVTFRAGVSIVLGNGFSVGSGARFVAKIDPYL